MGHTSGETPNPNKQNVIVMSCQSTGSRSSPGGFTPGLTTTPIAPVGSFRNLSRFEFAQSARTQQRTFNEQPPNPYVQHGSASPSPSASPSDSKNDWTDHSNSKSMPLTCPFLNYEGSHPWQQQQQQQFTRGGGGKGPAGAPRVAELVDEELLNGEQVLLAIPGAVVHLVDDADEKIINVHLASGEFSLVRFTQEKMAESVVIAKIGEQLKWPLVKDASSPTVKLDSTHYLFTLQAPRKLTAAADHRLEDTTEQQHQSDTLNYGLTLPAGESGSDDNNDDEQAAAARTRIRALDYFLQRYSKFSAPTKAKGNSASEVHHQQAAEERRLVPIGEDGNLAIQVLPPETLVSGDDDGKVSKESGAALWTTDVPNVDDYNNRFARSIAKGVGYVIEDIVILSDSAMAKLDSGHDYMVSKTKPKRQPSKVSPSAINGARSARRLTAATDKVIGRFVGGVVYATNSVSSAVVNSRHGKKFFKTAPGEIALVSLDAAVTITDAFEEAGKNILSRASSVTQDFVNHRYGDSARQMTNESLRSVGHTMSAAWSITKILDIDPKIRRELAAKANRRPARPDQQAQPDQPDQPAQPDQPPLDANPYVQHS